jgi:putative ABC transport system permease protein
MKFLRRKQRDEELDAEIQNHLDEAIRDRIARGETPDEARANAVREFGNVGLIKEVTRAMWGWAALERFGQDLRFGLRMLGKNPGFSLIAILTLALGIGANTAIFSVIDGVLFRALPYAEPDRLVLIWGKHAQQGEQQQVSYPDFADIRQQRDIFDEAAAMFIQSLTLSEQGGAERFRGMLVSANFFRVLGVEAVRGRTFSPAEDQPGQDKVVVISHRLWQNRFGAAEDIIRRKLKVAVVGRDNESLTVVGVMPAGFDLEFPLTPSFRIEDNDLWLPLTSAHRMAGSRGIYTYEVIARLQKGVEPAQARAALKTIGQRLEQTFPDTNKGRSFYLVSLQEQMTGNVRPLLLILLAAVGAVLLIACVNVASLLLGAGSVRQKEIAIRAALGAGRGRLARQLLTESLLLALLGGAAGLWLAWWLVSALVNFPGLNLPRAEEVGIDARVLGFSFGLALLTGLLFGLLPALVAARPDLQQVLKEGGGRTTTGGRRLRSLLIVAEVSLAFLLLVGAGLLTGSFVSLLNVKVGFDTERLLTFVVSLPAARASQTPQRVGFYQQLQTRLAGLPEVEAVGIVSSLPLSGHNNGTSVIVEGRPLPPGEQAPHIGWQSAAAGYFKTIGIPVLRGRDFTAADAVRAQRVALINESLARRVFPNEAPVGKRISFGPPKTQADWREIIGVVGDARHHTLEIEPEPRAYDLFEQSSSSSMFIVMRTTGDPSRLANAARQQARELEPAAPVYLLATMDELVARSTATRRFSMLLVGGFALIALLLAAVGIYGVLSFAISERRQEIGIRMALGARRFDILRLIVRQALALTLAGMLIGLAGSLLLTRFMTNLLYRVSPTDPRILLLVAMVLMLVALLACWIPARRATKVDPLIALRHE